MVISIYVVVRKVKLTRRLDTIAGCIEKGAAVADIGTDHGLLPAYLAQNELARSVIASDKSENSLKTAIGNAAKYGVTDKISFVAADGLEGVCEGEADTIVVAGVGGENMIAILEGAPWTKSSGVRLVLQPQTKIDKLYSWLQENGYAVQDVVPARDRGRAYTVILAEGTIEE